MTSFHLLQRYILLHEPDQNDLDFELCPIDFLYSVIVVHEYDDVYEIFEHL